MIHCDSVSRDSLYEKVLPVRLFAVVDAKPDKIMTTGHHSQAKSYLALSDEGETVPSIEDADAKSL
jgi:hypothetical protein